MTSHITSNDGTTLAVETIGEGAPVILIGGAFNDRSTVASLAEALSPRYTAVTYDRRARGGSDDRSKAYAAQSEIDDLAAVIEYAGGRANVFGHSSGAVLALEGVLAGLPIDRVAVYESPYVVDGNRPALPRPTCCRSWWSCSTPGITTARRPSSCRKASACHRRW